MSAPSRVVRALGVRLGLVRRTAGNDPDADLLDGRELQASDADAEIADLQLVAGSAPVRERRDWAAPRVVVVMNATPRRIAWLQSAAPGVELRGAITEDQALALLADADAHLGWCTPRMLDAAPRLRWLQSAIAGVDHFAALPALASRGILVTNLRGVSAPVVAEHAIAMLLCLVRGLHSHARAQRDADAERGGLASLRGMPLLVTGLGGVGGRVARTAHALGMRVAGIRNAAGAPPEGVERASQLDALAAEAARARAVVNTLPLTAATRGIFDARFFAALPAGAFFVNVGRGQSVVTDALVAALRSGHLAGAALDVTDPEPLPRRHPLRALPNVLLTPHTAGTADSTQRLEWLVMRENLRRYAAGDPMLCVVDLARGY